MSAEEKDWTFVDDDGFLLMREDTALYCPKETTAKVAPALCTSGDVAESSGSETEFEVISKKRSSGEAFPDNVDFIQIREDHFLPPLPADVLDDGSDIEVIRDSTTEETLDKVEERSDGFSSAEEVIPYDIEALSESSIENGSGVSTVVEDDSDYDGIRDIGTLFKKEDKGMTCQQSLSVLSEDEVLLSSSWVGEFENCLDSSNKDLSISWLFDEEERQGEQDLDSTVNNAGRPGSVILQEDAEYHGQSPKAFTIVFVVCASIAFGSMIGKGMVGQSKLSVPDGASVQGELRTDVSPKVSDEIKAPTESKPSRFEPIHDGRASLFEAWKTRVMTTRCQNMETAYRGLEIKYSSIERQLKTLQEEYHLFRLRWLLQRQGKLKQKNDAPTRKVPKSTGNRGPLAPPRLQQNLVLPLGLKFSSEKQLKSQVQFAQEETIKLKREVLRQKQRATIWRQRYLYIKLAENAKSRGKCESTSISLRTCFEKIGRFFNLTEIFQRDTEGGFQRRTNHYLNWIKTKASCGLKGFSDQVDYVWQNLKGSWTCRSKGNDQEGCVKEKKSKEDDKSPKAKVWHSDSLQPPLSKWARFRKILSISNVVGVVSKAVPRSLYKTSSAVEPEDVPSNPGKVKDSSVGQCFKIDGASDCLDRFKKRWNFRWRQKEAEDEAAPEDTGNSRENVYGLEEGTEIRELTSLPDNFEISYPLPLYFEPQITDKDSSNRKSRRKVKKNHRSGSIPSEVSSEEEGKVKSPKKELKFGKDRYGKQSLLVSPSELRSFGERLEREIRQKLTEQMKLQKPAPTEDGGNSQGDSRRGKAEEVPDFPFFKFETGNVERLLRRYSNRLRMEKKKYEDQLKQLRTEYGIKRDQLKRDRDRFSSWALEERLHIFQEIARNTQNFEKSIESIKKWKSAVFQKMKKKKEKIRAWLKEKVKKLLKDVEETKKRAEQEHTQNSGRWRREQLDKMKNALKEERRKIKAVHKYYKHSLQRAKQRLQEEKRVYETAKARAEELLHTYESLIRKIKRNQRDWSKEDSSGRGNPESLPPGELLVYPSVFCADQKSCTSEDTNYSFREAPSVLCPDQISCVDQKADSKDRDDRKVQGNRKAYRRKEKERKKKRTKRSFRLVASSNFRPLSKRTAFWSSKNRDLVGDSGRKGTARSKRKLLRTERQRSVKNSIHSSVHQLLKELRGMENDVRKCNGQCKGMNLGVIKDRDGSVLDAGQTWRGPLTYHREPRSQPELVQASSLAWRGPLQQSLSLIPSSGSRSVSVSHVHLHNAVLGRQTKTYGEFSNVPKKESTATSGLSGAHLPPRLLYKNGLPRYFPSVNASTLISDSEKGDSASDIKPSLPTRNEEVPRHALPFNWYLHYMKGREDMRSFEENERKKVLNWYLALAAWRRHLREEDTVEEQQRVSPSSSDNWYLRMLKERDAHHREMQEAWDDDLYL